MSGWSEYSNIRKLWKLFERNLERLCTAWAVEVFVPLLEADVSAYLYHLFVSDFNGDASRLHLETRIAFWNEKKKPYFVIGKVMSTENKKDLLRDFYRSRGTPSREIERQISKSFRGHIRPAVTADLILELKLLRNPRQLKSLRVVFPAACGVIYICERIYT